MPVRESAPMMFSKETCLESINKPMPDLVIHKSAFVDQGQNSLVDIVNGEGHVMVLLFYWYVLALGHKHRHLSLLPGISLLVH